MAKIRDYDQIVKIYNESGRAAAKEFIHAEYGVKQPNYILNILKNDKGFVYDEITNKYFPNDTEIPDSLFLNLRDLENKTNLSSKVDSREAIEASEISMKSVLSDLIQDRFLELSKYIGLQQSLKTVSINMTAMKKAGYYVEIK